MGVVCGRSGHADGRPSHHNDISFSSEMKSSSLSVSRSIAANELGPVSQRPSKPSHTQAAKYHRKQTAQTDADNSRKAQAGAPKHNAAEADAEVSGRGTKPSRPPTTAAGVGRSDGESQSSTSQLSARGKRAQRARDGSLAKQKAREDDADANASKKPRRKGHKRHPSKKKTATSGVVTPLENSSRSLESSQVLQPPPGEKAEAEAAEAMDEGATPPAPTNRMRSSRQSVVQSEGNAAATAADAATEATCTAAAATATIAAAAASETAAKDAHSRQAEKPADDAATTTKKTTRSVSTSASPPQPPPFRPRINTSPSPATAITSGLNSFSNSNPFFSEIAASHQLSDAGLPYQPTTSDDNAAMEQPSFEYENGYGMFFIDGADHHHKSSSSDGSDATTPAAPEADTRVRTPSPPTTPKAGKLLSRRNRRASFVSFGGEVRLT